MIENDFECYWHVLPKSVVKRYAMIAVQQNLYVHRQLSFCRTVASMLITFIASLYRLTHCSLIPTIKPLCLEAKDEARTGKLKQRVCWPGDI